MSESNSNSVPKTSVDRFAHFGTDAIHAGQVPDKVTGALIPILSLSTTFAQHGPGEFYEGGFEYSRSDNPTRRMYTANFAKLENAQYGLIFSSGSAVCSSLLHVLKKGDHVVCVDDVYGGTQRFFRSILTNVGLSASFCDFNDEKTLESLFNENTKAVWLETPTNPTLKVTDIKKVADLAHKKGAFLIVDNTFLTPYFQRPLDLGADIVVHSITKYLNGHSDVVLGAFATNDKSLYERFLYVQNAAGAIPAPFDCWLAMRGLKTLHLRMRQHEVNAFAVARLLEASPKVEKVYYPGLESHPQHAIAKKQQTGYGGMVSVVLKGTVDDARKFLKALQIFPCAESLGGVESLAEIPSLMTHQSVSPENRAKLGITDTLIRLSVGVEETDDLVEDIQRGLDAI